VKTVILDIDTGVDDAFAIMFAARHPDLNLIGITCVDGNTKLSQVLINTLKVLDKAGARQIPVSSGASRPLLETPKYAEHVHGSDGLGDLDTPLSARKIDQRPAIQLLRDLIDSSPNPVTLIPTAPLTNIALFLGAYPESAKKLERIVLMGGSASKGNATEYAEFNVWHDPEAAAIVFKSGIPITMYGLDVFNDLIMNKDDVASLTASKDECAQFAGRLIDHFISVPNLEVTLGDYGAVATAIRPDLATCKKYRVSVDTSFSPTRGQTHCRPVETKDSELGEHDLDAPVVDVVVASDVDGMRKLWLETVNSQSKI